jgi:propionyl-CoA carboxylase alpha chain
VTNRDFLVSVLRHPAFLDGDTTTDFIDRHRPGPSREPTPRELAAAALAAALAAQVQNRADATVLRTIPSGWRNNPSAPQQIHYGAGGRDVEITYLRQRDGGFACTLDGVAAPARLIASALPTVELEIDDLRQAFHVTRGTAGDVFVQDARGEIRLRELPRFPRAEATGVAAGGYAAPMPGKILDVRIRTGDAITRGQLLLTMEAMKMEHQIAAADDGVVSEVRVSPGQQVDAGQILVVIGAAG